MKKYLFLLIFGLSFGLLQAQDINDALRYSQTNVNGTARFRAMGGAFTALGGDLSAISINPASSAVFNNGQAGFTLSNYNIKNNSDYFGTTSSKKENAFDLNQVGGVLMFEDYSDSKWGKLSFAINYDNMTSFVDNNSSKGVNLNSSIGNYFSNQANGIPLDLLQTRPGETSNDLYIYLGENYGNQYQTAFLGYDTYILEAFDADNPENILYYSNIPVGSYNQSVYNTQIGYNGKLAFNIATEYDKRFYFGLNLNAHIVNYNKISTFYENNVNPSNPIGETTIRSIRYQTDLYTYGSGFSFQLGGIARITDDFRLGLTYQSPTWYRLYDELIQGITVTRIGEDSSDLLNAYFNPGIINIYPEYRIQSPAKYTIGGAYVFGNIGLISVDYSMKDYSRTKLKPQNDDFFRFQNELMADVLDMTSEVRVGAEAKIKQWSIRAGYNYEQSPYKDVRTIGDLQQYSAGFGYNFGGTKLDLAYSRTQREYNQALFNTGLTDAPKIERITNNVFVTLLFEF